jgi:hypothetical protein
MTDFITCAPYKIFSGDRVMNNEMGGACGTYGKEERSVLGFVKRREEEKAASKI